MSNSSLAEEVEDAGLVVPRCMWWSYLINTALGIVTLITMLFCIGDLDDAINSDTPYLDLFLNTGSVGVAILLPLVIFLLLFSGNVTSLATGSRYDHRLAAGLDLMLTWTSGKFGPSHEITECRARAGSAISTKETKCRIMPFI